MVDTETGHDLRVHEVGAISSAGRVAINELVNHGCTIAKFYNSFEEGADETGKLMSYRAVN